MVKYDLTQADTVYDEIDRAEQIVLSKYEQTGEGHESVEPELPAEKVSIIQLYRYADCTDIMLMCLGTIAAVCHGFAVQVNFFFMGETLDMFIETLGRNKSCDYLEHVTCDPDQDNQDLLELIPALTLGFFCVSCATLVLGYLHMMSWNTTAERQTRVIRFKAFHNILVQHMGYFDKHLGGELNTRMTEDMATYQAGIGDKVACGLQWISTFICGTILSFVGSWQLTLVIMFVTPIAIGVGATIAVVQRKFAGYESEAYANAGGMAEEVLAGIRTVAVYGGEPKENERYERLLVDSRKYGIQKGMVSGIGQGVVWFIVFTVLAISFWYGGILVRADTISPGKVLQVQFCMLMGLRNLGWSVPCLEALSISRGAAASIFKIIDNVSEIDSSSQEGKKLSNVQGNVTFENIWFAYPTRTDVPVLSGLNVEIPRGKTIALVGPSGCGKSTTIQLLQRQYGCQTGVVKLDGVDITECNIKWLRDQIGVVSQEPILFAATIMENLQFGRDNATKEEIIAATKEANAYDFIIKLPKGFETMLTEMGTLLSKGQKQRLCLARALIRKPAVLILDEATSALDNESESIVQAALEKASKGRTSIVIAHRLSTVRNADMLHVIKGGVVAESGTHDELMAKEGIYYGLVIQQLQAGKDQEAKEKAKKAEQGITDDYEAIAEDMPMVATSEREIERTKSVVSATSSAKEQEFVDDDEDFIDVPPPAMSRLFKMNAPEAHWLALGTVTAFIQGATIPALAILFGEVLGAFGIEDHEEQKEEINFYCSIIIFTGVLAGIFTFCMIFFFSLTGERLTYRLRVLAFRSMLEKEIGWFDEKTNQVGTLTSRLANDASRVKGATGAPLCAIVNATSTAFLSLMIGFIFGWQLAIAIACLLPFLGLTSYAQTRLMTSFARIAQVSIEEGGKIISESIDKIKTVAALTKEPYFDNKFQNYYNNLYKQGLKRAHIYGATWGISQFLIYLCFTVAFGLGGYLVAINVMTFNDVFRVFIAISAGGVELGRVNAFSADYSRAKVAAAKLFQLFERESKINPFETTGKSPDEVRGDVSFNDIRFSYPTREEVEVLRGFNTAVNHGQFMALVGASGSGKSAAVQLLERFYDPQYGTVELDGTDVSEWNIQTLRKQMAMVSQEPILFCTSVKDNIAYGDNYREVSMEEIITAAKSANIHNFIQSLPLGYDTSVGSKGGQLSGGQKQRVAIARALIRNPKIIILDDATSALDSTSEKVVQDALDKAQVGRTSIVIAHRLSTIVSADIICYCDRGRIVEKGTHAELMAQRGYYYNLQQKYLGLRDQ